jgi:uncharacterized membrane protein SpoIIM required for sporulation
MDIVQFRKQRQEQWRKLERELQRRRQGFRSDAELTQFVALYKNAANDLAYAQTYFPGDALIPYLNALVAAAHNRLYRQTEGGFRGIWRFFRGTFPFLFRSFGRYIALSALIMLAGAVYGFLMVWSDPLQAYQLLPTTLAQKVDPLKAGPHDVIAPIESGIIMTNNIQVALMAFVGGLTAGLFTVYALWNNGVILGVLASLFQSSGRSATFWSLIVPHGVTELLAIFIAGGAGLLFAHRLIAPGSMKRSAAVRQGAQNAALLMLGTVPMFVIAGTIEGFFTPAPLPISLKYLVAIATGLLWTLYFGALGRKQA